MIPVGHDPRTARLGRCGGILAAASLLVPAVAAAEELQARGRVLMTLGGGFAADSRPLLAVGGGFGLLDTGRVRLDLLGRFDWKMGVRPDGVAADGTRFAGTVGSMSWIAELALARRIGAGELWVSGGYSSAFGTHAYEESCFDLIVIPDDCSHDGKRKVFDTGPHVVGFTAATGARVTVDRVGVIGAEVRYQTQGESRFEGGLAAPVGGFSFLLAYTLRFGEPAPGGGDRRAVATGSTAAPGSTVSSAAPRECPPGAPRSFLVHPQLRFRCFPDPVSGDHRCGADAPEAEFVERTACEASCGMGTVACPTVGNRSAECRRCQQGCADVRRVACAPTQHGSPEGEGCRIEAGEWGLVESQVVPASCTVE